MNALNHIAFIMDGNGRWAKERGLDRSKGHLEGSKNVSKIIDIAIKNKIKIITLYAFSTENWKRPDEEVATIFSLINKYLSNNRDEFIKKGIQFRLSGSRKDLPNELLATINELIISTFNCDKIIFNLCVNYGGREEILHAIKQIKDFDNLNEESFRQFLYNGDLPDPELIVRTGGKQRISNFMLYEAAYSELYFTDKYWPDFNEDDFNKAIEFYISTERNFGGIK